ncbi:MAG: ATP-binding protein [Pseudomonadota bacterium]
MKRSLGLTLALSLAGLQIVAVTVVIASSYFSSERALIEHARDLLSDVANTTIEHSRGFLEPAKGAAELATRLAENEIVASDNPVLLEKLLFQQLRTAPQFAGVFYGDEDGSFVYVKRSAEEGPFRSKIVRTASGARETELTWRDENFSIVQRRKDPTDTYDPRVRPWYERAGAGSGSVWTDPYIFFTAKKPGITVASPVVGADGVLRGVIGVDIEISEISDFLARLKIGDNGRALILNRNGDVIAHPDAQLLKADAVDGGFSFVSISEIGDPIARAAFGDLAGRSSISVAQETSASFEFNGAAYVSTVTPIISERLPWTIAVYAPEEDFTRAIKENRSQNIVIAALVAAITAIVGLMLANFIHKPVRELAGRANQISRGRIEPPAPFPRSFIELDRAGRAFNRMSRSLTRAEDSNLHLTEELRAASRSLERRVEERTAELAAVNEKLEREILVRAAAEQAAGKEAELHRETAERLRIAMENATVANTAKTRFLSSMSHELRNPLNAIIGFSEILLHRRYDVSDKERQEYLNHVKSGGTHLLALVNDVLDLEKVEAGKIHLSMETVDPLDAIAAVKAEQTAMAEQKDIAITDKTAESEPPLLNSDPIRLRQVLGNLVSNAIKYTDAGGRVELSLERREDKLRISVTDNGPGIAEDLHHRVFEPFDRLGAEASAIEGSGVGLALSRQLVESLDGRIGFDSVKDEGSTFWIEIPVAESETKSSAPLLELLEPPLQLGSRRILYVDDSAVNLTLVEKYLSIRTSIELTTAMTAEAGLGHARDASFDVMLVDINLPDMSGYELLKQLRALQPGAVILAISADAMPEQVERGLQAGFDGYVTKPVDLPSLDRKLSMLLSRAA